VSKKCNSPLLGQYCNGRTFCVFSTPKLGQISLQIPPLLMGYVLGAPMGDNTFSGSTNAMLDIYVNIDTTYSRPEASKQQVKIKNLII